MQMRMWNGRWRRESLGRALPVRTRGMGRVRYVSRVLWSSVGVSGSGGCLNTDLTFTRRNAAMLMNLF
jgi:hypothetical protein